MCAPLFCRRRAGWTSPTSTWWCTTSCPRTPRPSCTDQVQRGREQLAPGRMGAAPACTARPRHGMGIARLLQIDVQHPAGWPASQGMARSVGRIFKMSCAGARQQGRSALEPRAAPTSLTQGLMRGALETPSQARRCKGCADPSPRPPADAAAQGARGARARAARPSPCSRAARLATSSAFCVRRRRATCR
jgi:hypothetical protein